MLPHIRRRKQFFFVFRTIQALFFPIQPSGSENPCKYSYFWALERGSAACIQHTAVQIVAPDASYFEICQSLKVLNRILTSAMQPYSFRFRRLFLFLFLACFLGAFSARAQFSNQRIISEPSSYTAGTPFNVVVRVDFEDESGFDCGVADFLAYVGVDMPSDWSVTNVATTIPGVPTLPPDASSLTAALTTGPPFGPGCS
ncbi:MAG: hypothetical protein ACK5X3_08965, partial [Pseudomonadota bacterium]